MVTRSQAVFAILSIALMLPLDVSAQARRAPGPAVGAGEKALEIDKVRGIGRQSLIPTPVFRSSVTQSGGRPKDWAMIEVGYDTFPEWIDSLTVRYFVLTEVRVDGAMQYSVLRKAVDYVDVEEGRGHRSAVFMRPQSVSRYGVPVVVHIDFLVDGAVVDSIDELDGSMRGKLPADWYDNNQFLQNDRVTAREGLLLNRAETPFALVNIDDYEVIR